MNDASVADQRTTTATYVGVLILAANDAPVPESVSQ